MPVTPLLVVEVTVVMLFFSILLLLPPVRIIAPSLGNVLPLKLQLVALVKQRYPLVNRQFSTVRFTTFPPSNVAKDESITSKLLANCVIVSTILSVISGLLKLKLVVCLVKRSPPFQNKKRTDL
jgi:hypothetical protein